MGVILPDPDRHSGPADPGCDLGHKNMRTFFQLYTSIKGVQSGISGKGNSIYTVWRRN